MISITDVKEKYKEDLNIDLLELLKKYDPSAQSKSSQFKFTKWLVSCTNEMANLRKTIIEDYIDWLENDFNKDTKDFDELIKDGFIKGKDSDVFKYKSVESFTEVLEKAKQMRDLKKREKEFLKYFENEDYLIGVPLTYEASKTYGSNTKWCTASNDRRDHFDSYSKNCLLYMISKRNHQKETYGVYIDLSNLSSEFPYSERGKNFNEIQRVIQMWNVKDTKDEVKDIVFENGKTKEVFTNIYESVLKFVADRPNIENKR